jgi:hypothetical protein
MTNRRTDSTRGKQAAVPFAYKYNNSIGKNTIAMRCTCRNAGCYPIAITHMHESLHRAMMHDPCYDAWMAHNNSTTVAALH